eukprot:11203396-Lingulodinium_polyedra.AAC.1
MPGRHRRALKPNEESKGSKPRLQPPDQRQESTGSRLKPGEEPIGTKSTVFRPLSRRATGQGSTR